MTCSECDRLQYEFKQMERYYVAAAQTLDYRAGRSAHEEYVRLRCAVNEARTKSEMVALELEQHKRLHVKRQLD